MRGGSSRWLTCCLPRARPGPRRSMQLSLRVSSDDALGVEARSNPLSLFSARTHVNREAVGEWRQ